MMGSFFSLDELSVKEILNGFIRGARDRGIDFYPIVLEETKSASSNAPDDQNLDAEGFKHADKSDVAVIPIVMNFLFNDLPVFDFNHFEIGGFSEVLEDFTVLISNSDSHKFRSFNSD